MINPKLKLTLQYIYQRIYKYKFSQNVIFPLILYFMYKNRTGHPLDLKNPKRFSEKIQWLKLYDNCQLKTDYSDKIKMKDIVKKLVPEINIAKVYGIWDSFDEIDFSVCPDNFVLKTNHGSSMNLTIKDKNNMLLNTKALKTLKKLFDSWFDIDFSFEGCFEFQYHDIEHKIFAEERLGMQGKRLSDYKIHCFNGVPKFIEYYISGGKTYNIAIYNEKWEKQDYGHSLPIYKGDEILKPVKFDLMMETAAKLSNGFKFARIDFFEVDGKLYFAEVTFTPRSGFIIFSEDKYDFEWGDLIDLNNNEKKEIKIEK